MNLGLGNLSGLKEQLLAAALRESTDYDAPLTALGKGVAAQFDAFTNRKLARAVADTFLITADRELFFLPRYPVEALTTVELKDSGTTWTTITSDVLNWNSATGEVYFGAQPGPRSSQLRVTFTGGYWVDETEEGNDVMPATATAVP